MTTSRPLISAMQVTLDGYSSEGDAEWVDSWADGLALLPPVGAFVLGGGMFPDYERWWATILEDPGAASDMLGRDPYPREIDYARLAAKTPHLVLSKTLTDPGWPTGHSRHRRHPYVEAAAGQGRLRRWRPGIAQQPHQRRPPRRTTPDRPPGRDGTRNRCLR
jgi:hypothetical protein